MVSVMGRSSVLALAVASAVPRPRTRRKAAAWETDDRVFW